MTDGAHDRWPDLVLSGENNQNPMARCWCTIFLSNLVSTDDRSNFRWILAPYSSNSPLVRHTRMCTLNVGISTKHNDTIRSEVVSVTTNTATLQYCVCPTVFFPPRTFYLPLYVPCEPYWDWDPYWFCPDAG